MTYDLHRLRAHGLIERVAGTFRYTVTDTGRRHARFLTRVHDRLWRAGLAQLTDPDPPGSSALPQADRAYHHAIDQFICDAGIAAPQPTDPPDPTSADLSRATGLSDLRAPAR